MAVNNALLAWALAVPGARAIARSDGSLLWANPAMQNLIAAQSALRQDGQKLTVESPANLQRWKKFLEVGAQSASACRLAGANAQDGVILVAMLIPGQPEPLIGLRGRLFGNQPDFPDGVLPAAFGLTRTENELIAQMFRGFSADEIAAQGKVSLQTVRTHIRNIYGKLDVGTREGMFNRLIPYLSL